MRADRRDRYSVQARPNDRATRGHRVGRRASRRRHNDTVATHRGDELAAPGDAVLGKTSHARGSQRRVVQDALFVDMLAHHGGDPHIEAQTIEMWQAAFEGEWNGALDLVHRDFGHEADVAEVDPDNGHDTVAQERRRVNEGAVAAAHHDQVGGLGELALRDDADTLGHVGFGHGAMIFDNNRRAAGHRVHATQGRKGLSGVLLEDYTNAGHLASRITRSNSALHSRPWLARQLDVSSDLKLSGDLRDHPFAKLVGQLARKQATGVLEVHDPIGVSRAFFVQGAPQGARLSRLKHPIGRILVEENVISEERLNEALAVHNRTDKLLGQEILLEMKFLTDDQLSGVMARQSQLNFLSLFAAREGRFEFLSGLVHLTDFAPAPMQPLATLYLGVRDYARIEVTSDAVADLTFRATEAKPQLEAEAVQLQPAEQMAAALLKTPRFTGDLARSVPLAPKALRAFVYALTQLELVEVVDPTLVPRAG